MSDTATISAALVAALSELENVTKKHRAENAPGKHTFANIADVIADTRPVLAAHDIVALTPIHDHGGDLACTVVLLHKSGERLDFGPTPFPHGKDAQATGSWITYMRRYCLLAALGMGAEDDDGAAAKPRQREQSKPAPLPKLTPAAAKTKLVEHLTGKVPGDVKEHAAAVWTEAEPGDLTAKEMERLLSVADEYLADLEAMKPEQPELVP